MDSNDFNNAVLLGDFDKAKELYKRGIIDDDTVEYACIGGNPKILKWLFDKGCILDDQAFRGAAHGGHFDVMKSLLDIGCPYDTNVFTYFVEFYETPENGIDNGIEVLEWLKAHNFPYRKDIIEIARANGNAENIEWIIANLNLF